MACILLPIEGLLCLTQAGTQPFPFSNHSPAFLDKETVIDLKLASLPWWYFIQVQQHFKTQSGHNLVQYLGIMRYFSVFSIYSVPKLNLVKANRKVHSTDINEFISHALKIFGDID